MAEQHHRGWPFALAVLGALLAGVLGAVQSRMNGALAVSLGEPLQAAWWSFGSGLAVLVPLLLTRSHRRGLATAIRAMCAGELDWIMLSAGALGGILVGIQSGVVPLVGVALFTVSLVAGQTAGGLVVDAFGVSPGGRRPATPVRLLATAVALTGVFVAVSGGLGEVPLWPALLSMAAGFGTQFQGSWNGRITTVTRLPMVATLINFCAGTLTVGVLMAIAAAVSGARLHPLRGEWWVWWGGVMGLTYVAIAAVAIRYTGMLLFTLVNLCAQLLTAFIADVLTPGLEGVAAPTRILGMCITALGAGLAGWAGARARRAASR